MNRRDILHLTGTVTALTVTGCLGIGGDDQGDGNAQDDGNDQRESREDADDESAGSAEADGNDEGTTGGNEEDAADEQQSGGEEAMSEPAMTVEEWIDSFDAGATQANAFLHEHAVLPRLDDDEINPDLELEERSVSSQTDETAVVSVTLVESRSDGTRERYEDDVGLRKSNGEWKVVEIDDSIEEVVPASSFTFEYSDELRIVHAGGDAIPATQLRAYPFGRDVDDRGWLDNDGEATGAVDGEDAVVSGDSVTFAVDPDYEARVVWTSATQPPRTVTIAEKRRPPGGRR